MGTGRAGHYSSNRDHFQPPRRNSRLSGHRQTLAIDVFPSGVEGYTHPVHLLTLVALGTPIPDNQDLEALSAEAERQGRWEFLLTAAPLAIPGGTGSPLNAIATF